MTHRNIYQKKEVSEDFGAEVDKGIIIFITSLRQASLIVRDLSFLN